MLLKRPGQPSQDANEPNESDPSETPGQEQSESQQIQSQEQGGGDQAGDSDLDAVAGDGEQPTPQEVQEMNRANAALAEILYKNDDSVKSIVQKLSNNDIPPINRLADTTLMLTTKIDKDLDLDEEIILPFIGNTYEKVCEVANTSKAMRVDDDLKKKGLMVTIEMALKAYGVSPEEVNQYMESIGMDKAKQMVGAYQKVMA